jgi:two-component system nitrogen regulation response regulator GlnG/two-component system response regulator HydG
VEEAQILNIGQCPLSVNGRPLARAIIQPGDTIYLHNQLLLYCVRRPRVLPPRKAYPESRVYGFGEPDGDGMVGESPPLWKLRDRVAAAARADTHVLVIGDSGSGKELAAQAIHRLSRRASRPLIADNIACIPPSLASALLFGNRKNFPNPGMEERIGLIGAAHGSTLFLDEIGDMPEEVQPMFLRVAERAGEYFRLGEESRLQRSDFRLVGATNHPERMRYELKRRFQREVWVPGLNHRKEDVPLLIRHLLRIEAEREDLDASRFLRDGQPQLDPRLVEQLLHHTYKTHVSEVGFLLGQAMAESEGDVIMPLGHGLLPELRPAGAMQGASRPRRPRPLPSPEDAQQALQDNGGDVSRTAAALNVSRDQLNRMIRRYCLDLERARGGLPGSVEASPDDLAGAHKLPARA